MKISVNQQQLAQALKALKRNLNSRPSHPVLAGYLFDFHKDALVVTAIGDKGFKDAFCRATAKMPANVIDGPNADSSGIVVPSRGVTEIIGGLPKDSDVALEIVKETNPTDKTKVNYNMVVSSGPLTTEVEGIDPDDFPSAVCVPDSSTKAPGPTVEVPADIVSMALKGTLFAASKDPWKAILSSVSFDLGANGCLVVATDGHRLAHIMVEDFKVCDTFKVEIPRNIADQLSKLLGSNLKKLKGKFVKFAETGAQTYEISYEGITLAFSKGEERYPGTAYLFPDRFKHTAKFNTKGLLEVLNRAEKVANLNNNVVKLTFEKGSDRVMVSADKHNEFVGFDGLPEDERTPDTIGFNVQYLIDGLKEISALGAEEVILSFNTPTTSAVIEPFVFNNLNVPFSGYRYLVLPVQIRS